MSDEAIVTIRQALQSGRLTINALDDGSGVLLDIDGEQLLTLNPTGMALIQAVDEGADSAAALGRVMNSKFEVSAEAAEADARAFLAEVAAAL